MGCQGSRFASAPSVELSFVHGLVTAGGLASDGSCWKPSGKNYLFPVEVMGVLLRGKMLATLRRLHAEGAFMGFEDFADPEAFERLMSRLAGKQWVVYAKKPFGRVDHVLKYLGRYTHRVGIANSRLVDVQSDAVTFRTKNGKQVTLTPVEFLLRFVQHVLPEGLHKSRHYGLYAGAAAAERQSANEKIVAVSGCSASRFAKETEQSFREQLRELTGRDVDHCPSAAALSTTVPCEQPISRGPPRAQEPVA